MGCSLHSYTPLVLCWLLGEQHVGIRLSRAQGIGIIQQVLHVVTVKTIACALAFAAGAM